MIEISHRQARSLIRASAEKRLPEEQWRALQTHLERCAACREAAARQESLQKMLRRGVGAALRPVEPPRGLARGVIAARAARASARRAAGRAGLGLLGVLLLALFWAGRARFFPGAGLPGAISAAAVTEAASQPAPTVTPLPADRFTGVVAYSALEEGSGEIFLLHAAPGGVEIANLTGHPADDTHPAWSPDGEWLAFLSDRSGKREIWMINVTGTRTVQRTDEPGLDWQGPLGWSSDGKWVGAIARRADLAAGESDGAGGEQWLYLVPGEEGRPVAVSGARGALRFRFSPRGPMAAFQTGAEGLRVIHTISGAVDALGLPEDLRPRERILDFAWDEQGLGVVTLTSAPRGSRRSLLPAPLDPDAQGSVPQPGSFPVLSAPPADERLLVFEFGGPLAAALDRTDPACPQVKAVYGYRFGMERSVLLPDLCVWGGLDADAWSTPNQAGNSWLVFTATERGGNGLPGIYAMGREVGPGADVALSPVRLADLPGPPITAIVPAVRPLRPSLGLRPQPAAPFTDLPQPPPAPAELPVDLPGPPLAAAPEQPGQGARLFFPGLGGSGWTPLTPQGAAVSCPALSPDRSRAAFLGSGLPESGSGLTRPGDPQGAPGANEVYVANLRPADGSAPAWKAITRLAVRGRAARGLYQRISCPAWSPDGRYIAVLAQVGQGAGVMVMTPEGQVLRNVPSDPGAETTGMAWTPDGRALLLAQPAVRGSAPRIVMVPWRDPVASRTLLTLEGWEDIHALSISPDGARIAFVLARKTLISSLGEARLRVVDADSLDTLVDKSLPDYDLGSALEQGRIAWMQDHQLVVAIPHAPLAPKKALLLRFSPEDDTMQILADPPDRLYDWAISGGWLLYSTESGLWGAPILGRLEPMPAPIRLSPRAALSVSW